MVDATIGRLKRFMAHRRANRLLDESTYRIGDSIKNGQPSSINLNTMRAALEAGANPNRDGMATGKPLLTEAFFAQKIARIEYIKLLIGAGANPLGTRPDAHDARDRIPVFRAFKAGTTEEFLEMMKSPFMRTDEVPMFAKDYLSKEKTWNLAMLAASCNMSEVFLQAIQDNFEEFTLPKRPDLPLNHLWTAVDDTGMNALMLPDHGGGALTKWLLQHPHLGMRDHLEVRDKDGQTALWYAAQRPCITSVKSLLAAGADPLTTNNAGIQIHNMLRTFVEFGSDLGEQYKPVLDVISTHQSVARAGDAIDRVILSSGPRP